MATQSSDSSSTIEQLPPAIAARRQHGFRQVLAAVTHALADERPPAPNVAHLSASRNVDRMRTAATAPSSGWAELLLQR